MAPESAGAELARRRERQASRVAAQRGRSTGAVKEEEAIADLCCRLEAGLGRPDLAKAVLEPVAGFIGAETAVLRSMPSVRERTIPRAIGILEIPDSVGDAYGERFYAIDPARRLPSCSRSVPIFADPVRPGQWLNVRISPAISRRLRREFLEYRRAFLEPNDLVQHLGFYFDDGSGRTLLFDFHRGRRARQFDRLEIARTRVVACYLQARMATRSTPVMPRVEPVALNPLSSRESEVAAAVANGLSNKEVAAALNISVRTVENHMRSIFAKLGVGSRTRLAAVFHGTRTGTRSAASA